jgi:ribosome recycling factor
MDRELEKTTVDHMTKSIEHLGHELMTIRTGRASAALLDTVKVDYYGVMSPIKQIATVTVPDAKTIMVQPFQQNMLHVVEKAIRASDLGLNPNNDGHVIRLPIPSLTEDRRKDILKIVKKLGEDTRIAVRNIRRDAIEKIKASEKAGIITEDDMHRGEKEAQDLTDEHIKEVDRVILAKEKEIMTI